MTTTIRKIYGKIIYTSDRFSLRGAVEEAVSKGVFLARFSHRSISLVQDFGFLRGG